MPAQVRGQLRAQVPVADPVHGLVRRDKHGVPRRTPRTPAGHCAPHEKGSHYDGDYGTAVRWSSGFGLGAALGIKGVAGDSAIRVVPHPWQAADEGGVRAGERLLDSGIDRLELIPPGQDFDGQAADQPGSGGFAGHGDALGLHGGSGGFGQGADGHGRTAGVCKVLPMTYGFCDFGGLWIELCDECGFDGRNARIERLDIGNAFATMQHLVAHADADRRPTPETWSAVEYAAHSTKVTGALIQVASTALGRAEPTAPGDLMDAASAAIAFADSLSAGERRALVPGVFPFDINVAGIVAHLLHDLEHHVLDVRKGLASLVLAEGSEIYTVRR